MPHQADLLKRSDFNNEKITPLTDLYLELDKIKQKTSGAPYSSYHTKGFRLGMLEKIIEESKVSDGIKKRIINYLEKGYNLPLNRTVSLIKFAIHNRRPVSNKVSKSMFAAKRSDIFYTEKKPYNIHMDFDEPSISKRFIPNTKPTPPVVRFIVDTDKLPDVKDAEDTIKEMMDKYKQDTVFDEDVVLTNPDDKKQSDFLKQSDFSGYTVYGLTNLMTGIEANKIMLNCEPREFVYDFFSSNRLFCIDHVLKEKIVEYVCGPHGFGNPLNRTVSLIHQQIVKLTEEGKTLKEKHDAHVKAIKDAKPKKKYVRDFLKRANFSGYTTVKLKRICFNFELNKELIVKMSESEFQNYCLDVNFNIDKYLINKIADYLYTKEINHYIGNRFNRVISLIKQQIAVLEEFNKPTYTKSTPPTVSTKKKTMKGKVTFPIKTDIDGNVVSIGMTRKIRRWNENDVTALRKLYPFNTVRELMPLLNRSYDSIASKIKSENITK